MSLFEVSYEDGTMVWPHRRRETEEHGLASYLDEARTIVDAAQHDLPSPLGMPDLTADFEHLRWFPLPDELRLGWPLPLRLAGVRGALFVDTGAGWDGDGPKVTTGKGEALFRIHDDSVAVGISVVSQRPMMGEENRTLYL